MGKFGNDRGGFKSSYSTSKKNRGSSNKEMHDTVCSMCDKKCRVPFRPNGSRPMFCSFCYEKKGEAESAYPKKERAPRPERSSRPSFDTKQLYQSSGSSSQINEKLKDRIDSIDRKLDKILRMLAEQG